MPVAASSTAAGSVGGLDGVANGVFVAAALVFMLAYKQVLEASQLERSELDTGLLAAGTMLAVTFAVIVCLRTLAVTAHLG